MPETFDPVTMQNDQGIKLNAAYFNRLETNLETLDDRVAGLELGAVAPVNVAYASTVTLNAAQGTLFRIVATGDLTLTVPANGTEGQFIIVEIQAVGADRTVTLPSGAGALTIPAGQWQQLSLTYHIGSNSWVLGAPYGDKQAQNAAAQLLTGGSHTGVTFTYNSAANRVDAVVSDTAYINVKDAPSGAVGNGVTDDTAAISAKMDAANAAGAALFFPPGTYVCSALTKAYAPKIMAVPGTATILATNTASWTWNFAGTLGSAVALTADAARGAFGLTITDTTGLTAGDLILVGDTTASYANQSTRTHGQIVQIASVDSATALTVVEGLYEAFTTAASAFVAKVTAPSGLRIAGLKFLNTNASSTGGFIRTTYLRNLDIDVDGEGSAAAGIRLAHCHDFRVRTRARNYFDNPSLSQFGYAVEAVGACSFGEVDAHAIKVRHAFTATGLDGANGEPTNIRVTGVAHGCTAQAWDAHAQGSDIVFADCQSFGARSYGFALRGRRQHIQGGVVAGGYGGAWLFEAARDNRISGLRVSDILASDSLDASTSGGRGVRVQNATAGLTVTGCEFVNIARDGVVLDAAGTDVAITANLFRNVGRSSGGGRAAIHAIGALTRARITNNIVADNQGGITTQAAITLDAASTATVLRDNDVQPGIPELTGTGANSVVTRTTRVDSVTPWLPASATAAAGIASTIPGGRVAPLASAGVLSSGRLTLAGGIVLAAGVTISSISFLSAGTAAVSPTNSWFCLVAQDGTILAKTADAGTAAWGADAVRSYSISGGYTPVVDIPVYLGIVVVAATVPTLQQLGIPSSATGRIPMLAATAATGLTDPASLTAVGTLTALPNLPFAFVS